MMYTHTHTHLTKIINFSSSISINNANDNSLGNYTIKVQFRHENQTVLTRLSKWPLFIERQIPKTSQLNLDFYTTPQVSYLSLSLVLFLLLSYIVL
jgi:hypothetical protein